MVKTNKNFRAIVCVLVLALIVSFVPVTGVYAETYSGDCGAEGYNITWEFDDETETLTISGSGIMKDYASVIEVPWYSHRLDVTKLIIDDDITHIGRCAFALYKVESANLPEKLVSIGGYGFNNCMSLTEVIFPNNLKTIGEKAFGDGRSLRQVTFSDRLESIDNNAFENCSSLTDMSFTSATPPTLGTDVFKNISTGGSIYYPSTSTSSYEALLSGMSDLTDWTLMAYQCDIALDVDGTYKFVDATEGYGNLPPLTASITNNGDRPERLTIAKSGKDADSFVLSRDVIDSIAVGGSDSFTIVPKTGLPSGTYSSDVTVKSSSGASDSFAVSFTVKQTEKPKVLSSNKNLKTIKKSTGKLSPKFKASKKSYKLKISKKKKFVKITPKLASSKARLQIKVGKGKYKNVKSLKVKLNKGKKKVVRIKVIAEDKTTKVYKITVSRGK